MKQELNKYCLNHRMTYYEVFCKAYADFLARPLDVREYGKMHEQSREYLAHDDTELPHFVKYFLINERRSTRRQTFLPLDL